MKFTHGLLVVLLIAALAAGLTSFLVRTPHQQTTTHESRLDQIKRTGVLRCGYFIASPFDVKDPNTGKMSGVMYDLVEEMGRQLKLKIDWKTEVAPGQMFSDLALNRIDMVCTPFNKTPGRAREGDFTASILYLPMYLYVRKNDTRFDHDVLSANRPEIRLSTLDGEYSSIGAEEHFPLAQKVALPELATTNDIFLAVSSKKADAVVNDYCTFLEWNNHNAGKLRIAGNQPLGVVGLGMPIPANEPTLKATLDTTLAYLHDSGYINKVLNNYEATRVMPRVARPYASPEE